MEEAQSKQRQQKKFLQIKTLGIVKITNNAFKDTQIIEIAQMLKAEPIATVENQYFPKEGGKPREISKKQHQLPFSAIGIVFTRFKCNQGYGTAFLIADNVVLTAAHNVYSRVGKSYAKYVDFIIGIHQKGGKRFRVVCVYVPKEYKQPKQFQEQILNKDFAILIFEGSDQLTQKNYGKIQLNFDVKVKDKIKVCGYPGEFSQQQREQIKKIQRGETDQKPQLKYLFDSQDEIVEIEKARIFYKALTTRGNSGSPILKLNSLLQYEAVGIHTHGNPENNSGVRITGEVFIRINKWIQEFCEGKQNDEGIMLIDKGLYQITAVNSIQRTINKAKISITPDTTTYAWKQNKYRQDNANKNVCISNGGLQWLCSSDLCDGECVFTIKVHKVYTYKLNNGRYYSCIRLGLMDSNYKGKQQKDTFNHCVYLSIGYQRIWRPNQEQTKQEGINCSCQPLLSVPCLIECHVNRYLSTITWYYNGKEQAKTNMPQSWKDRRLCAVVILFFGGDCVEFM